MLISDLILNLLLFETNLPLSLFSLRLWSLSSLYLLSLHLFSIPSLFFSHFLLPTPLSRFRPAPLSFLNTCIHTYIYTYVRRYIFDDFIGRHIRSALYKFLYNYIVFGHWSHTILKSEHININLSPQCTIKSVLMKLMAEKKSKQKKNEWNHFFSYVNAFLTQFHSHFLFSHTTLPWYY